MYLRMLSLNVCSHKREARTRIKLIRGFNQSWLSKQNDYFSQQFLQTTAKFFAPVNDPILEITVESIHWPTSNQKQFCSLLTLSGSLLKRPRTKIGRISHPDHVEGFIRRVVIVRLNIFGLRSVMLAPILVTFEWKFCQLKNFVFSILRLMKYSFLAVELINDDKPILVCQDQFNFNSSHRRYSLG